MNPLKIIIGMGLLFFPLSIFAIGSWGSYTTPMFPFFTGSLNMYDSTPVSCLLEGGGTGYCQRLGYLTGQNMVINGGGEDLRSDIFDVSYVDSALGVGLAWWVTATDTTINSTGASLVHYKFQNGGGYSNVGSTHIYIGTFSSGAYIDPSTGTGYTEQAVQWILQDKPSDYYLKVMICSDKVGSNTYCGSGSINSSSFPRWTEGEPKIDIIPIKGTLGTYWNHYPIVFIFQFAWGGHDKAKDSPNGCSYDGQYTGYSENSQLVNIQYITYEGGNQITRTMFDDGYVGKIFNSCTFEREPGTYSNSEWFPITNTSEKNGVSFRFPNGTVNRFQARYDTYTGSAIFTQVLDQVWSSVHLPKWFGVQLASENSGGVSPITLDGKPACKFDGVFSSIACMTAWGGYYGSQAMSGISNMFSGFVGNFFLGLSDFFMNFINSITDWFTENIHPYGMTDCNQSGSVVSSTGELSFLQKYINVIALVMPFAPPEGTTICTLSGPYTVNYRDESSVVDVLIVLSMILPLLFLGLAL